MSFLTFKTDDAQREANANAFLSSFRLGAAAAQKEADNEVEESEQANALANKRTLEQAKQEHEDALKKLTLAHEDIKSQREDTVKALQLAAAPLKETALNQDADPADRERASILLNYIGDEMGNPNAAAPNLTALSFVRKLTPAAQSAHTGTQLSEAGGGQNAAAEYKLKQAEVATKTAPPAVGDDVSNEALNDAAAYQSAANTSGRLSADLKDLSAQRKAIDPASLDQGDIAKAKELDAAIKAKQAELDAANKSLDLAHSKVLLQAQYGGFGPNVTSATNQMLGGVKVDNPFDVRNHDFYGNYINGRLSDPTIDENTKAGYSRLGLILNAGTRFQDYWNGPAATYDSDPSRTPSSPMEDWKSHADPSAATPVSPSAPAAPQS